jgi:hypothetical protein
MAIYLVVSYMVVGHALNDVRLIMVKNEKW